MFLPIILWVMLTLGRCYCLILADVIANIAIIMTDVNVTIEAEAIANLFVEDVKPHFCLNCLQQVCRLMLLPVADGRATAG